MSDINDLKGQEDQLADVAETDNLIANFYSDSMRAASALNLVMQG